MTTKTSGPGYAQLGMEVMLRKAYAQAARSPITGGLSSPRIFADQMKSLDDAIGELKVMVETYVVRTVFKDSFNSFYNQWMKFYQDAQTVSSRTTIQIFDSEAFGLQIEDFRRRYIGFKDGYSKETDADGKPLNAPKLITPAPIPPQPDEQKKEEKKPGWTLPWYVWMLGGVVIVGGGYWVYKKALVVRDARREIDKALPSTLGSLMPGGHGVGTFIAKHSPANDPDHRILVPSGISGDMVEPTASGDPAVPR
jgi:hypothetical protein